MNDDELKKRLLAAFRGESKERMRVLSSDFLNLEKGASREEAVQLIESSYRELHSLKGAARAVGLIAVEKFCQSFESFFSVMKKKGLSPSREVCSDMMNWLDVLEMLMGAPEQGAELLSAPPVALALSRMSETLRTYEDEPVSIREKVVEAEVFSVSEVKSRLETAAVENAPVDAPPAVAGAGADNEVPRDSGKVTAPVKDSEDTGDGQVDLLKLHSRSYMDDSMRISSSFITGLLLRTEELISSRNSQIRRAEEILVLEGIFSGFLDFFNHIHEEKKQSDTENELAVYGDMEDRLHEFSRRLGGLSSKVQKAQWELASKVDSLLEDFKHSMLLPFSSLLDMYPRMVRSLGVEQGKNCRMEITGENVRIDRRILDELSDPLMHMIRNSIDHGIEIPQERRAAGKPEIGRIFFNITKTDRDVVRIVYGDDGRGIDSGRLRVSAVQKGLIGAEEAERMDRSSLLDLVFISGMSTSEIITDISGRGLGMAIVRDKIESLGGSVVVASTRGRGIRLVMNIPVALTSFRGIVVGSSGGSYVIPKSGVGKVKLVRQDDIGISGGRETLVYKNRPIPLVSLADILELEAVEEQKHSFPVLIMGKGRRTVAISVDELRGEHDVMAKSMGSMLKRVRNVAGISMLGTGELAPILHGPDMVRTALGFGASSRRVSFAHQIGEKEQKTVLVAEDSITSRMLLKNVLEAAGYRVVTAVDGRDALNRIKQELPDILVSDVEMPHMDGFSLTGAVRKMSNCTSLPIVLVTSLGSREDRERGIEAGADAYIIKSSFDQGNLLDVVGRLVD